ncbi:hypothetical protein MTsPCn9_02870 [Croceitalea sp. MTPC9]|uniref:glycosyl hydrolase n=1 Tax=unclassified Croceitalea TaxID=2632280 RepID=UPI002B3BAEAF|nr:hypothetical protein MTsPCn6_05840 [Croceitalea sp. MTPC6]GMN15351.1 hypothetical protein MTsPCn9_02870 [Croceitalea sp. MTPC9]
MKSKNIVFFCTLIFFVSCTTVKTSLPENKGKAENSSTKFEPKDGECLLFIGQDMAAVGGLNNYSNGYCDYFKIPAGITIYTGLSIGGESYGHYFKGNDGIKTTANWGAGDTCGQCYLEDDDFDNSMISIGLSMVNNEKKVAKGEHNELIRELAQWIKDSKRPIFLRIGYEFDGWDWNHYNRRYYLAAWKRIREIFKEMKVNNVAFVWQSKGTGSDQEVLEEWYPGDELVDWCAYSYFSNPDQEMLIFARNHNKPVFIAEATPVLEQGGLFFNADLSDEEVAKGVWEQWFTGFISTLNNNKDVIKAFSYINADWSSQPMWTNNPVFQRIDSRIQESEYVSERWKEEMANPRYLKASSDLWKNLKLNE